MKTLLPNIPILSFVISGLILAQPGIGQNVREKTAPARVPNASAVEKKESENPGLWGIFKKEKPTPAPEASEKKLPKLSKTGEVAAQKKSPAPLVKPEDPKKPGFFARVLNKLGPKEKAGKTESDTVSEASLPPLPDDWATRHIVTEDDVEAYSRGPSQPGGADEVLKKGTVVSMKKSGKAWAEISVTDGRTYTVGADQIRKAKLTDFAPKTVATAAASPSLPSINYEPLPTAELPETTAPGQLELPELLLPPLPPP